jgi:hypothetical protein
VASGKRSNRTESKVDDMTTSTAQSGVADGGDSRSFAATGSSARVAVERAAAGAPPGGTAWWRLNLRSPVCTASNVVL